MEKNLSCKFIKLIEQYLKINEAYFISKDKKCYCFDVFFKNILKKKGIEKTILNPLRTLGVLVHDETENRYDTKRINPKTNRNERVVAINIEKYNALKELIENE